jgi:4-amino-4-deoxy-L-arabinose transferase-like glycosyltransferase
VLAGLIFVDCVYLYNTQNKFLYGVIAGACLGLIIITRYYTAVLIFLPFFFWLLYHYRQSAFRLFFLMALGSIPFIVLLLWYNYATTGSPFVPVTMWAYKEEGLGFINSHTPLIGLEHIIRRFLMFIYWCSPVILFLYFFFIVDKIKFKSSRTSNPEDYIFLSLLIGYFFYWEIGGNQYGPRFYFEALPFMIVFVVAKSYRQKKVWAQFLLYAAFIISLVRIPFIADREHSIIDDRKNVYHLSEEKNLSNAVVIMTSGTSPLRPMPSGDLTRNDRNFSNDILYAIDRPQTNAQLMEFYSDRKIYRYVREPGEKSGRLIRVR